MEMNMCRIAQEEVRQRQIGQLFIGQLIIVSLNPLEQMNLLSRLHGFQEERFSWQSFCGLLRRR